MRNALLSVAAGITAVVMAAVIGGSGQTGQTAQTKISIKIIQMYRSVTVSPTKVACGNFTGGNAANPSTSNALGFPGQCTVGKQKGASTLPLLVTYNGPTGMVQVKASNAVPDNGGPGWQLCGPGTSACNGPNGKPGLDQFRLQTFSREGPLGFTYLTRQWQCDTQFNSGGYCTATRGLSQREGALIIGPKWTYTPSTTYTVTVTWMAA
ncbi:MAG TPA: hypothetical protein VIV12_30345, partial [Streptosporangiaceae bacterium]